VYFSCDNAVATRLALNCALARASLARYQVRKVVVETLNSRAMSSIGFSPARIMATARSWASLLCRIWLDRHEEG
jgi:hypothetical protein